MKRVLLKTHLLLCHLLFYVNHRIYMRCFNAYLKAAGTTLYGVPRYIGIHVKFDDFRLIEIGDKTTISDECHLLTHDYSITNAMRATGKIFPTDIAIVRGIKIGNNCFIGKRALLLPGTEIGDHCIIGGGSVVRGKIASNSVVIGNPATTIATTTELATKWEKYIETDAIRKDKV